MSHPLTVAFATCSQVPGLYDDDRSILKDLAAMGIQAEAVVWDSDADWATYDAIVIRSAWYYWLKYPALVKWISEIEKLGIPVLNPPAVLKDNTRKEYLERLEHQGIPCVPTHWIRPSDQTPLHDVLRGRGWSEAVMKPTVSGGAFRTHRFNQDEAPELETKLQEILQDSTAMVQPLISTILSEGEYSFLFYGGKFSHSALKRGPAGEFRIQRTFGGTVTAYLATNTEINQAQRALAAYCEPESLLYARVDMVRDPNNPAQLLLMELELTEPNLFFLHDGCNPGAGKRFSQALRNFLSPSLTLPKK